MQHKKGFSRETFVIIIVYALTLAVLTYLAYKFLYGSGATSLSVE